MIAFDARLQLRAAHQHVDDHADRQRKQCHMVVDHASSWRPGWPRVVPNHTPGAHTVVGIVDGVGYPTGKYRSLRRPEDFDGSKPYGMSADFSSQHFLGRAPSPSMAQRLGNALIDAGLAWTGSSQRLLVDPIHWEELVAYADYDGDPPPHEKSGIDLGRKDQVEIEGGYVGGRYNESASTEAWIADAPFED